MPCRYRAWILTLLLTPGCSPGTLGGGDAGPDAARTCAGCVDEETGACLTGASDVACGAGGALCVACGEAELCEDHACVARTGCGPGNCPGCCDGLVCSVVDRDELCGSAGDACVACGAMETCIDGECTPDSSCGPANCAGCCDDSETCQTGDAEAACGGSGGLCAACEAGWTCESGRCRPPCEEFCGGCCDSEGVCHTGTEDALCGDGAAACADCGSGAVCTDQVCVELACSESCDGCCAGSTCEAGTEDLSCGVGGSACVGCGLDFACALGDCLVEYESRWDVIAVRAAVPVFNPSAALWDPGSSGRPDPYVTGEAMGLLGEIYSGQTARIDDTIDPEWNEVVLSDVPAVDLLAGMTLRIRDYDLLSSDDDIGWCYYVPTDEHFGGGRYILTCPARTSDPETVEVTLVVELVRHTP